MIMYVFKLISWGLVVHDLVVEPWADRGGAVRSAVRPPRPNRAKSVAASGRGRDNPWSEQQPQLWSLLGQVAGCRSSSRKLSAAKSERSGLAGGSSVAQRKGRKAMASDAAQRWQWSAGIWP
uniref:Uncharacterized protein n=1 Tax=Ananas comosus var. bracteatus TaxID=296719 RepID=A0A6V7Q661_ANACO|nr:unnamed protein product [Ananas comosus var. bracteatus]